MTTFVELPLVTESKHVTVWLNRGHIVSVEDTGLGACFVCTVDQARFWVDLPASDVVWKLEP